jgi:hypothetical protein
MDLQRLYAGSFIDWEAVAGSWNKRTIPSRLLLFAARRYLDERDDGLDSGRYEVLASAPLPEEIKRAFASPPELGAPAPRRWGEFVDAAVAAELEMVTEKGRWFLARRDALPGTDLPDDPGYLPI